MICHIPSPSSLLVSPWGLGSSRGPGLPSLPGHVRLKDGTVHPAQLLPCGRAAPDLATRTDARTQMGHGHSGSKQVPGGSGHSPGSWTAPGLQLTGSG